MAAFNPFRNWRWVYLVFTREGSMLRLRSTLAMPSAGGRMTASAWFPRATRLALGR